MEQRKTLWQVRDVRQSTVNKIKSLAGAYNISINEALDLLAETNYEALMDAAPNK